MSLNLSLKDLYSPISHLVQTVIKYCKFISVSGRRLNNLDTSIIWLITYICLHSDMHANSYPHRSIREGEMMGPLPRVFDMLQYFETILP